MTALRLLTSIGGFGALVPVAIGAFRLLQRPSAQRATWVWMTAALAINLWMRLARLRGEHNNFVAEATRGLYALFALYAMSELVESTRTRRWMYVGLGGYLCWWMWRAIESDYAKAFGEYSGPALYLVLSVGATLLILDRIRRSVASPMREFGMLIGLGTLISYAPMIAIEAVSALFYETYTEMINSLWTVRAAFAIIGLIFFSLAFAWTIPSRSSSGSSASAA